MRFEIVNPCRSDSQKHDLSVRSSIKKLEDDGHEVLFAEEYVDPSSRARIFVETVGRNDIDCTWVVRGGIETAYLLPHIDFSRLVIRNKVIGSSDFTHLALPILKLGESVIYGPVAKRLVELADWEREELYRLLKDSNNGHLRVRELNGGKTELQPLVGGTLQILLNLLNTKYVPEFRDCNLFVEHHYLPGESYLEVKYWLSVLRMRVDMNQVKSLLVGELVFGDGVELANKEVQMALVHEVMGDLGIPVGYLETSHRTSVIKLG